MCRTMDYPRAFAKVVESDGFFYVEDRDGDKLKEFTDFGWLEVRYRTRVEAASYARQIRMSGRIEKVHVSKTLKRFLNSTFFVWWRWQEVPVDQYVVLMPAFMQSQVMLAMIGRSVTH